MEKQEFMSTLEDCIAAGVTLAELAEKFRVTEGTIARWRNGQSIPGETVRKVMVPRMQALL